MARHRSERQWRMFEETCRGLSHDREELFAAARLRLGRD